MSESCGARGYQTLQLKHADALSGLWSLSVKPSVTFHSDTLRNALISEARHYLRQVRRRREFKYVIRSAGHIWPFWQSTGWPWVGAERVAAHMTQCADSGKDETTNQGWRVVAVPFKLRSDKDKHLWEDLRPSTSSLAWLGLSEAEPEPSEPVCFTLLFQKLI